MFGTHGNAGDPGSSKANRGEGWRLLARDWEGGVVTPAFEFQLSITGGELRFEARRAVPAPPQKHQAGEFCKGLWKSEVAEFFLAGGEGTYVEFNLSPGGAWWSCAFSSARVPQDRKPVPLHGVESLVKGGPEQWWVEARIPLEAFHSFPLLHRQLLTEPQTVRADVCGVVAGGEGEWQFLSTVPDPKIEADFHRPEVWRAGLVGGS